MEQSKTATFADIEATSRLMDAQPVPMEGRMIAPQEQLIHMKRWQCHKVVSAEKIERIDFLDDGGTMLHFECGYVGVSPNYMQKHQPQAGGYFVVYEDGYRSFSPADAFEAGYTRIFDGEPCFLSFGQAIDRLKAGERVARSGWNGAGMWVQMQVPDEHSKMRRPYLYMSPVGGDLVPWVASQSDMLADDWLVVL